MRCIILGAVLLIFAVQIDLLQTVLVNVNGNFVFLVFSVPHQLQTELC